MNPPLQELGGLPDELFERTQRRFVTRRDDFDYRHDPITADVPDGHRVLFAPVKVHVGFGDGTNSRRGQEDASVAIARRKWNFSGGRSIAAAWVRRMQGQHVGFETRGMLLTHGVVVIRQDARIEAACDCPDPGKWK